MPWSKDIQERIRNRVIDICQPELGYKAISKALGLHQTTVTAIIHKWRKHGTVVNLPRSGRPTRITPRVMTSHTGGHKRSLNNIESTAGLAWVIQQYEGGLGRNGIRGRIERRKPLLTKKNTAVLCLPYNMILMIPKTFGKTVCGLTRQKWNFLGRCASHCIWRKTNKTF